jgi:hypothetical protein
MSTAEHSTAQQYGSVSSGYAVKTTIHSTMGRLNAITEHTDTIKTYDCRSLIKQKI